MVINKPKGIYHLISILKEIYFHDSTNSPIRVRACQPTADLKCIC